MEAIKRETSKAKIIALFIAALPLLFLSCDEEQVVEDSDYVEISEYRERFAYEEWDLDASGAIEERELSSGIFESMDADDDSFLSNDEWGETEFYFTGKDYGAFNEWDINNDGMLDEEEFEVVVDKVGLFDSWDINDDGWLEDQELSSGVFDSFDADDDGLLDDEEYGTWEDYQPY